MTEQATTDCTLLGGARLRPDWWLPALTGRERLRSCALGDARPPRPAWSEFVEQAIAAARPVGTLPQTDAWQQAFAVALRPFTAPVRHRLADHAARLPACAADAEAVARTFTEALAARLARIGLRTLMHELGEERAAGLLAGADGRERFADFLRRQGTPAGQAALAERYPVLARLLGTAALTASDAGVELIGRLAADRAALIDTLLGGVDPGPATVITAGLGDPHRGGRSVALVRFADGRTVVYKPRGVEMYARFGETVSWVNTRVPSCGLRTPRLLPRDGYGWMEFVTARPLSQAADAHSFYFRLGVLLALLYALHGVDMHCENVIAAGDQPVLIDVETLFHPTLPTPDTATADPAAEALAASVGRTGLLPYVTAGENGVLDRSGMGGDAGEICPEAALDWDPPGTDEARLVLRRVSFSGADNRPRLDGRVLEPADYAADVLEGFRLGYDAILLDRAGFVRLAESCRDLETRVVIRPSAAYARLIDESTAPALLRDATDRDAAFDVLDAASGGHELWQRVAPDERATLWAGDLPLISCRAGDRDLWTGAGQHPSGLLERSGLVCALTKIAGMDEVDQSAQEWVIAASLASRRPAGGHRPPRAEPSPNAAAAAAPRRLLAAASGLADQIVAHSTRLRLDGRRSRVNWLGLQLVEDTRWMVLPMGAALGDGYLGVALFLAQLARLTGIARYAEVAREAVNPVPDLWAAIADRPDLLAAVGCGATEGLGGIAYGLTRLAALLDDDEVRGWAQTAVELADAAALRTADPWWTTGHAGCLAAMTAIHTDSADPAAAAAAASCAARLVEFVDRYAERGAAEGGPSRGGFGTGSAGVGWALARHAARVADPASARAAEYMLRLAVGGPISGLIGDDPGWCRGTAGRLIARSCLPEGVSEADLDSVLTVLAERPVLGDLSLCHGELGTSEALITLAAAGPGGLAFPTLRHRAGLVLHALQNGGPICATPDGVVTPGLLHGLAGIGHGLLRLGFGDQVPSILLLEPAG